MTSSPPAAGQPTKPVVAAPGAGTTRLDAIARGEAVQPVVHKSLQGIDPVVDVQNFNLWYGPKQALFDINMGFPRGQVTAIIGPSGCGKITLLRCINRMNDLIESVEIKGEMRINGQSIYSPGV